MFARAKKKSGEIAFNFRYLLTEGLLHSASKKSKKVLMTVVFFLIYFAALSLVFEFKENLESPAIIWNELLTTKKYGITLKLYGEK